MFGISMSELLVILVLALVVVGPKDLPKVALWLARVLRAIRNMVKEFVSALNIDEEIKEVNEAGKELRETMRDLNPGALKDEYMTVEEKEP